MVEKLRPWFADRSTGDLLILGITATICFVLLASGAVLGVLAFFQPERDLTSMVSQISDVINTMIGLMAGFLAGRQGPREQNVVESG